MWIHSHLYSPPRTDSARTVSGVVSTNAIVVAGYYSNADAWNPELFGPCLFLSVRGEGDAIELPGGEVGFCLKYFVLGVHHERTAES